MARSIATDSAGNAIVAGDSDEGGLGLGILVIKYSPAGEALWANRFNTPGEDRAAAVAVDGSDNVFVTGSSGNGLQHVTIAFSSLGVPLWTNQFNGPGGWSYTEGPSALAVDGDGNVFVTGRSQVDGTTAFATLKYSGPGVPLWTNRFVGNGGNAPSALAVDNAGNVVARAGIHIIKYAGNGVPIWTNGCPAAGFLLDIKKSLGMDGTGNVFILGKTDDAGNFPNNLIVKYSSDGTVLWTNRYPGYGQSLAVDSMDNVAVTGDLWPAGNYSTIATIKYSAAGAPLWTNEYDLGGWNFPFTTVAVGSDGEVFVSGYSSVGDDQVTIKYSAAGSELWTRHGYTSLEDDEDYPRPHPALAVDPSGNALVTGYFFNDDTLDFATRKYASDGDEAWAAFYDGRVNGADAVDYPSAVAVDSLGNIIVTGGENDYATIKYSPSGVPLWTNYYDGPAHFGDRATAVAVASNGNIFVTGYSYPGDWEDVSPHYLTIAYTGGGVPLWTNSCLSAGIPVAVATDGNGDVIVTGNGEVVFGDGKWVTIKYSGAGMPVWTNRHDRVTSWAGDMAVDGRGNIVVVGQSAQQTFATIKFSSSGSAIWTNLYTTYPSNAWGPNGFATAVGVWTNGDIFVTGYNIDPYDRDNYHDGSQYDFVTIKYSETGVPLWTNHYGAQAIGDYAYALTVDNGGNVVVAGVSQNNATNYAQTLVTIKYSNDGMALWTNLYAGSLSRPNSPYAVAVDGNGNVFVTGGSGTYPNSDSVTLAYSSSGVPLWTNRYHGPAGHNDVGYDLAVTGVGDVVVVGASSGDYATVKYDSGFALAITSTPLSRTNNPGTTATFFVSVFGTAPFTFQWQRNGTNLMNGGNISGATSSNLTLNPALPSDAGSYTVVISNPAGSLTSVVAVLSVPIFQNVTATVAPGLPPLGVSSVSWGDYDSDGLLDFLLTGGGAPNLNPVSQLWRNTGSGFVNVTATVAPGLPGVRVGSVAWADFDNDGRLDFLIMGTSDVLISQLWRNTGSGFTNVTATVAPGLPAVTGGSVAWGDFDNDGRIDFLITGERSDTSEPVAQLWRNTGGGFTNLTASLAPGLPGVLYSSVAWAITTTMAVSISYPREGSTAATAATLLFRNCGGIRGAGSRMSRRAPRLVCQPCTNPPWHGAIMITMGVSISSSPGIRASAAGKFANCGETPEVGSLT